MVIGKIIRVGTKAVKEVIKASKSKPSDKSYNVRNLKTKVSIANKNIPQGTIHIFAKPPGLIKSPTRKYVPPPKGNLQAKEIVKYVGGLPVKKMHASHSLKTNKQLPTLSQPGGFFLALGSRKKGTTKAWAVVREGGKTSLKKYKGGKTTTYSGIKLKRPTANQSFGLGFGGVGVAGLAVQDWDKARDNLPFLLSKKKDKPKKKGKKE